MPEIAHTALATATATAPATRLNLSKVGRHRDAGRHEATSVGGLSLEQMLAKLQKRHVVISPADMGNPIAVARLLNQIEG